MAFYTVDWRLKIIAYLSQLHLTFFVTQSLLNRDALIRGSFLISLLCKADVENKDKETAYLLLSTWFSK